MKKEQVNHDRKFVLHKETLGLLTDSTLRRMAAGYSAVSVCNATDTRPLCDSGGTTERFCC
jgi:hypothetical protein